MKKLLNIVYITTEGASLRKDGENLVAEVDGAERARVPFHMLSSLVLFGAIYISPALIGACAASGITIVLLDRAGRFQARVEGPVSGNVLLRRAQYRVSEAPDQSESCLTLPFWESRTQITISFLSLQIFVGDSARGTLKQLKQWSHAEQLGGVEHHGGSARPAAKKSAGGPGELWRSYASAREDQGRNRKSRFLRDLVRATSANGSQCRLLKKGTTTSAHDAI